MGQRNTGSGPEKPLLKGGGSGIVTGCRKLRAACMRGNLRFGTSGICRLLPEVSGSCQCRNDSRPEKAGKQRQIFSRAVQFPGFCLTCCTNKCESPLKLSEYELKNIKIMGKAQQGIYGAYKGRVGNVVGYTRNGTQVYRIRAASVKNPRTEAQEDTRMRFSIIGKFLSSQLQAVNTGFDYFAEGKVTATNEAMRMNFHTAITGTYPDLTLDCSKAIISKGDLVTVQALTATAEVGSLINLTWIDNSGQGDALAQDSLIVGVYCEALERGLVFYGLFNRSDAAGTLQLPATWAGEDVHVMAFFRSGNVPSKILLNHAVSDTVYGGSVTLLE
jgi:hypothetical protein